MADKPDKKEMSDEEKQQLQDLQDRIKGELFKRQACGSRSNKRPDRPSGRDMRDIGLDVLDNMAAFMEDPFNSKGWARSKRFKTGTPRHRENIIEYRILGLTDDEAVKARVDGKLAPLEEE